MNDLDRDFDSEDRARFENSVVESIAKFFNLAHLLPAMRREQYNRTGNRSLPVFLFNDAFPSFPVALDAVILRKANKTSSFARLFDAPENTPLFREYNERRASQTANTGYMALIVKWPYCKLPLVLHDFGSSSEQRGTRMLFTLADREFVLEALPEFLGSIGTFDDEFVFG